MSVDACFIQSSMLSFLFPKRTKRRGGSGCGIESPRSGVGNRCFGRVGPSARKITRARNQKRPGTRGRGRGRSQEGEALNRSPSVGRGGPGIKTGAHKKSLCVRDAEAHSERNSHSPPKFVVRGLPSESGFAGQPAGSFPVRPDFLPVRRIRVRTQAPSRSPGFLPVSPHHVKSTMKSGKSKRGGEV